MKLKLSHLGVDLCVAALRWPELYVHAKASQVLSLVEQKKPPSGKHPHMWVTQNQSEEGHHCRDELGQHLSLGSNRPLRTCSLSRLSLAHFSGRREWMSPPTSPSADEGRNCRTWQKCLNLLGPEVCHMKKEALIQEHINIQTTPRMGSIPKLAVRVTSKKTRIKS